MIQLNGALAALALTVVSAGASAETREAPTVFGIDAESDVALAAVRGTAAPFAFLTRNSLAVAASAQSRDDFRLIGSVSRVQMDVWWGTIGSESIATAVRAGN